LFVIIPLWCPTIFLFVNLFSYSTLRPFSPPVPPMSRSIRPHPASARSQARPNLPPQFVLPFSPCVFVVLRCFFSPVMCSQPARSRDVFCFPLTPPPPEGIGALLFAIFLFLPHQGNTVSPTPLFSKKKPWFLFWFNPFFPLSLPLDRERRRVVRSPPGEPPLHCLIPS